MAVNKSEADKAGAVFQQASGIHFICLSVPDIVSFRHTFLPEFALLLCFHLSNWIFYVLD